MVIKNKFKIVSVLSMICLCVLGLFIPAVAARDDFAPTWLKEGTYVKYVDNPKARGQETNFMRIFDVDDPQFKGMNYITAPIMKQLVYSNASLTWQCVSVTDTTAKLQVTFEYVGEKIEYMDGDDWRQISLGGESFQRTGVVYVDLYTRAVHNAEGDLLGTTHLWLPANPVDGQEMVVWDVGSETVTIPAEVGDTLWTMTPQGVQDIFNVADLIRYAGRSNHITIYYDLDTGLGVGGVFEWDPIMAIVGIDLCQFEFSGTGFSDTNTDGTNIDMGPARSSINWTQILQYTILPIAIILLIATLIIKRRKKKN